MDLRMLFRRNSLSVLALAAPLAFGLSQATAQAKKPAPAAPAKPAAAAPKAAAPAATHAAGATGTAGHAAGTTTTTAGHAGTTTTTASRTTTTTTGAHGASTTSTTATHSTTTAAGGVHPGAAGMAGRPGGASPAAHGGVPGVNHGNLAHAGPAGSHDRVASNGNAMRVRADGHPADFHDARRGMDVHNNLGGGRRVMVERHDGSRMYYERGRPGYISHQYNYHGHEFARRSYYYNGRYYDRFYNHYGYNGLYLDVYAPVRYYGVGFYGWAYNPWAVPVAYAWGFNAAPWYGYYGAYFTPYPVYATPSLWLTDYLISQTLEASYAAHQAAAAEAAAEAGAAPPAPLTPETKALIAEEVRRQVALENAEAQANTQQQVPDAAGSSIARMLTDGQPHVFVAGQEVDVTDANGQECAVTDGDVLQLKTPPAPGATTANLIVMSSKGGVECRSMATVTVGLEDLQNMQNHMRETLDMGLQELQSKQGKNGIPAAPASALAPPTTAAVAVDAPAPDPAGAKELMAQAQEADTAQQEVTASVAAGGPSDAAPAAGPVAPAPVAAPTTTVSIAMGMTTAAVTASAGQPTKIINLGPKVIYVYPDMKVTFTAGKVSHVE